MAKGKQITPPQGVSKTGQTTSSPAPQAKPQFDRTNLARTGSELPKTDVIAESGYSAEFMAPGVPGRNTPTRALTSAEASVPVVPPVSPKKFGGKK
jgi:hypothetical protein